MYAIWLTLSSIFIVLTLLILLVLHLVDEYDRRLRETVTQNQDWRGMPKIADTPPVPGTPGPHHPETDEEWSARQW